MPEKSFTKSQWTAINDWVRAHRGLINVHGSEFAASVAKRSASNFPVRLEDGEWSILRGARPSASQIRESMRVQQLFSKRNKDGYAK